MYLLNLLLSSPRKYMNVSIGKKGTKIGHLSWPYQAVKCPHEGCREGSMIELRMSTKCLNWSYREVKRKGGGKEETRAFPLLRV